MKIIRRNIAAVIASVAVMAAYAQTADNTSVTVGWVLNSGTISEAPAYTPESASQFIDKTEILPAGGIGTPVAKTSDVDGITQTMFPVSSKTSSASDNNAVSFVVTLKDGIAFTPTRLGFKAFRWKTDKGNFDVTWFCDSERKGLASGLRPNRGAGS